MKNEVVKGFIQKTAPKTNMATVARRMPRRIFMEGLGWGCTGSELPDGHGSRRGEEFKRAPAAPRGLRGRARWTDRINRCSCLLTWQQSVDRHSAVSRTSATPGPRYAALLQLLRTSETIWNASRLFFARWDLSPSQFNVLNVLYGFPEGLTQVELSRELITHRSNVTGLVDRLEKRGLLRRAPVPGDRRAYRVTVTAAGTALLTEILPEYHGRAELALGGVPLRGVAKLRNRLAAIETAAAEMAEQLS
ncbi:MAG TPA: hypothetical protein DCY13_02565, partial [Verrucomicrobiales bacterium]|nr:hypothetical protein [Verrucomicrobiales bacterium]